MSEAKMDELIDAIWIVGSVIALAITSIGAGVVSSIFSHAVGGIAIGLIVTRMIASSLRIRDERRDKAEAKQ